MAALRAAALRRSRSAASCAQTRRDWIRRDRAATSRMLASQSSRAAPAWLRGSPGPPLDRQDAPGRRVMRQPHPAPRMPAARVWRKLARTACAPAPAGPARTRSRDPRPMAARLQVHGRRGCAPARRCRAGACGPAKRPVAGRGCRLHPAGYGPDLAMAGVPAGRAAGPRRRPEVLGVRTAGSGAWEAVSARSARAVSRARAPRPARSRARAGSRPAGSSPGPPACRCLRPAG